MKAKKKRGSKIQSKLIKYIWICVIPLIILFSIAIIRLYGFYQDYDLLVRNITSANEYNMSFKESMDEMMYRIIIGSANWTNADEKLEDDDPKALISEAKEHFIQLREKTTEDNVRADLTALIRLLEILDERVEDILKNVEEGGHYDENMEMLDMNIRTLTSLIQEDIQKYIYDEAQNMEMLRRQVASSLLNRLVLPPSSPLFTDAPMPSGPLLYQRPASQTFFPRRAPSRLFLEMNATAACRPPMLGVV